MLVLWVIFLKESYLIDIHVSGNQTLFLFKAKKARKWDFSSNPLPNPWNPRISSTDYWRTDYWVGEVCRQIQTSLWNLHPKPFLASAFFGIIWQIKVKWNLQPKLFILRIFQNHLSLLKSDWGNFFKLNPEGKINRI